MIWNERRICLEILLLRLASYPDVLRGVDLLWATFSFAEEMGRKLCRLAFEPLTTHYHLGTQPDTSSSMPIVAFGTVTQTPELPQEFGLDGTSK